MTWRNCRDAGSSGPGSRRELEAEQGEKSKNVLGITTAVGVVATDGDVALVIEQPVEDM